MGLLLIFISKNLGMPTRMKSIRHPLMGLSLIVVAENGYLERNPIFGLLHKYNHQCVQKIVRVSEFDLKIHLLR